MIEPLFRTAVDTLSTVNNVVLNVAPENTVPPYVRIFKVSGPRGSTHDGPNGLVTTRFQVDIVASTYQSAKTHAAELYPLQSAIIATVSSIRLENERDGFQSDTNLHTVSLDFLVYYKEV